MLERSLVIIVKLPANKSDQDLALVVEPFLRDTLVTMGGSLVEFTIETTDVEDDDFEPPTDDDDCSFAVLDDATTARITAVEAELNTSATGGSLTTAIVMLASKQR